MKFNNLGRKTLGCSLLAAPLLLLNAANSQAYFNLADSELYAGAGYGLYKFDLGSDTDFDEDEGAIKVFVGGKFTEFLGLEATYYDFDEANDFDENTEINGWSIAPIVSFPLNEYVSIYGKVGIFFYDFEVNRELTDGETGISAISNSDFDGEDIFYGGGLKIGLIKDVLDLKAEYEYFEFDDDNFDPELELLSVSLQYVFEL